MIRRGLVVVFLAAQTTGSLRAQAAVSYADDVQPILAEKCFSCHGPDAGSRKAGLRLDAAEHALRALDKGRGHVLVPGAPARSEVWRRVASEDPDERMPPPEAKQTLSPTEKATLRAWIEQGARYEPHWAFQPLPASVPLPPVRSGTWPRVPLDRFVLARLEKEGLAPSPEAPRERWLRRVSYDLTGLPPTPEEIAAFVADADASAHEKVVDRLLASPHFGERMALSWLDAARYADSYGYQSDQLCTTWPWRDFVVKAFADGMPYDRFLTLQLAGDLVAGADRDTRLATGFLRLHRQTNEGGSIEEEFRTEYAADRVHTLGTAFLSLSLECARCHDHKFDPITQRDYYALFAFVNSIDEWGTYNDSAHVPTPTLPLPSAEQERALATAVAARAQAEERLASTLRERRAELEAWVRARAAEPAVPDCVGAWSLDALGEKEPTLANAIDAKAPGRSGTGNRIVASEHGNGLLCSGDDAIALPSKLGALPPWQPFSVRFRVRVPSERRDGIVFHRTSGTDTGFHGTELVLEGGHLRFTIQRFWPGNALSVRAEAPLPLERQVDVVVTHDGSARASGVRIHVDGARVALSVVRDRLTKSPGNGGGTLDFAERFRSTGLAGAVFDEIALWERALTPLEIAQLHDGVALANALRAGDVEVLAEYWASAVDGAVREARAAVQKAVAAEFAARDGVLEAMVMEELPTPRATFVLERGRYDAERGEARRVARDVPAALPPLPKDAPRDRLGLARWLVQGDHPLTARTAVNRFWQLCFGRGLVDPVDNLGVRSARPSHRELLDWLARDFVARGWDVKAFLRSLVLSATYRQDSVASAALRARDPENRLLARGPSQRLGGELLRDTALFASGLLVDKRGGPPVSPYQPGDLWREANAMSPAYHQSKGEGLWRRSLYTVWKRTAPMPNMTAFGAPSREVCTVQRATGVTPQQALVLLNDPQFVEAARCLAERTLAEEHADEPARLARIFARLAGRAPLATERDALLGLLERQRARFATRRDEATKLVVVGARPPAAGLDPVEVAAWTCVVQAVLNLDAVTTKR